MSIKLVYTHLKTEERMLEIFVFEYILAVPYVMMIILYLYSSLFTMTGSTTTSVTKFKESSESCVYI